MKTPLKVGDRVAVYDRLKTRFVGTVKFIAASGLVNLGTERKYYHPKQCRRLKPKRKLREWVVIRENTFSSHYFGPIDNAELQIGETIIVREVPARKGEK